MPNDSNFAIQTQALSKHYGRNGEIKALQTLSLEIRQGELFGFLGPNGAGKSTAIRTLLGFLHPTGGVPRSHACPQRSTFPPTASHHGGA